MKVGFVKSIKGNTSLNYSELDTKTLYRLTTTKHTYKGYVCIPNYCPHGVIFFTPHPVFLNHEHCQDLEFEELSRGDYITLTLTQE